MNRATKLLLLSAILVLLAIVIGKLQGPGSAGDQTASLRDRRKPDGESTRPSRLSGQPQILRAKQESGLETSPSPWHLADSHAPPESAPPVSVPVFPTGQPMVAPAWLTETAVPGEGETREKHTLVETPQRESQPQPAVGAWPPDLDIGQAAPSGHIFTEHQDSFWRISERVYGTGKYYKALYQHNRRAVLRPDQLEAGIQIATPPLDELRSLYPQLCPDGVPVESPRGA